MDILEIVKGLLTGLNFTQIIGYIVGGMFVKHLLDKVFVELIVKYWPDKFFNSIKTMLMKFDDDVIDKIKEKYPKSGKKLEKKLSDLLINLSDIVLDK